MAKIIEIEGLDCVGKETQSKLLKKHLEDKGYKVKLISYPNYENKYSQEVSHYLKGEFDKDRLTPERISLFYTMDRLTTQLSFEKELKQEDYDYIILDRGIFSNILNQGTCFLEENGVFLKESSFIPINIVDSISIDIIEFISTQFNLEFRELKLLKPDYIIVLDLDNVTRESLLKERNKNNDNIDIIENNFEYLRKVQIVVNTLRINSRIKNSLKNIYNINLEYIKCYDDNVILPKEDILNKIIETIGE